MNSKRMNKNKNSSGATVDFSVKKELSRMIRLEHKSSLLNQTKKWIETTIATTISSTASISVLTNMTTGATNGLRIGNKILAVKIYVKGVIVLADTTNVFRLIVFKWLMNNNSDTPSASEIFTTANDPSANNVPLKPSRFKKLSDQHIILDAAHVVQKVDTTIKLNDEITYDPGTNSGINQLFAILISDSSAAPHVGVDINFLVEYIDSQ